MATAPAPAPAQAAPAPAAEKVLRLRAVHGEIVHAFDGTRFSVDTEKKHVEDAWVKMQVDAGKLQVVTD